MTPPLAQAPAAPKTSWPAEGGRAGGGVNNRGTTLVELVLGMAVMAVIGGVVLGLFGAGLKSFRYTLRQTFVLTVSRRAFEGDGPLRGMIWAGRNAGSAQDLSPTGLNGIPHLTLLQTNYYNVDEQGHVVESANASEATMVTALIQTQAPGPKTYSFFSGAQLRNHP